MRNMKKLAATFLVLTLTAVSFATTASADTKSYNWTFGGTSTTMMTEKGYKNDNEQNYYITISSGTLSSTNKFGTRVRRSSDAAMVSPYVLHTGLKTSQPYAYTSSVNTKTLYELRGKKDTTSTTSAKLQAVGKVTY